MRKLLALPLLAAGLSGCGILYTNIHGPYAYRSASPAEVKAAPSDPTVSGVACNYSVLYLVAWGDGGYASATKKALEGKPEAILYDVKSDLKVTALLLGLYTRTCTKVTGRVGHS